MQCDATAVAQSRVIHFTRRLLRHPHHHSFSPLPSSTSSFLTFSLFPGWSCSRFFFSTNRFFFFLFFFILLFPLSLLSLFYFLLFSLSLPSFSFAQSWIYLFFFVESLFSRKFFYRYRNAVILYFFFLLPLTAYNTVALTAGWRWKRAKSIHLTSFIIVAWKCNGNHQS